MSAAAPSPGWCRDCFAPAGAETVCHGCGSHRLARHAEIATLGVAHLDCDAFYAAVEKRDDPSLEDQPVIVGGGVRGVVTTACYVARAYGVRSAMPMFKALKACPDAVVVKPNMAKYAVESKRLRALMADLTPLVEPISIDEAFLDMRGTERLHHAPPALTLMRLQARVAAEIGITVSIGLSFNKFLAKIASDLDKPNGFSVIGEAEAVDFLTPKPVRILPGVGPAFAAKLERDGLRTVGDLRRADAKRLAASYGEAGWRLHQLANARDARIISSDGERKRVSSETTFNTDVADAETLSKTLWRQCVRVADRAKAEGVGGRVVTLKLKTARFQTRTRRRTVPAPLQLADSLFRIADPMLRDEAKGERFRLLGVGLSDLEEAGPDGGDLLDPDALKRAAAERATDALRAKFGSDAVVKGRGLKGDD